MNHKPRFITFTGADDHTDPARLADLSARYPIEWGLLMSPQRAGSGRYPSQAACSELVRGASKAVFSAHLCGGFAKHVIEYARLPDNPFLQDLITLRCERVQVNTAQPITSAVLDSVEVFAQRVNAAPILQCREDFPKDYESTGVYWLLDASGGRGITRSVWPKSPEPTEFVGYAGGLGPSNVAQAVEAMQAAGALRYWIDMESSLRDENDRFSLDAVEQVCRVVYGDL